MAGCNKCGSPEGNSAKLCPKCTADRIEHLKQMATRSAVTTSFDEYNRLPPSSRLRTAMLGCLAFVAVATTYNFRSHLRALVGLASPEDLETACLSFVETNKSLCSGFKQTCSSDPSGSECGRVHSMVRKMMLP